jgi:hypothetical protein
LVSQFYHFSTFFYRFLKSFGKRKGKGWNSDGPVSAQRPSPERKGARAHPRPGCFAQRPSRLCLTANEPFHYFEESLTLRKKPLRFLSLRTARSPTTAAHREAPASHCTGRLGQWPALLSGGHQIGASSSISPNLIARTTNYWALATVTESIAARWSRSRRPEDF